MTFRTSAVAASRAYASAKARLSVGILSSELGRADSFNLRAFVVRFLAGALSEACLRPARVFGFAASESDRPPRLRPFAFDSPRLICRRPMDSASRVEI